MSSNNEEYFCYECFKKYPNFAKYQTHIKIKHRDGKSSSKISINQEEIIDLQDKMYSFLGQLSQSYYQSIRSSEPENLLQQHRFIGQANYLPNLIVRTPYEAELNIVNELPKDYQFMPIFQMTISKQEIENIVKTIQVELKQLCQKLSEQRTYWQFADPLDPTVNFQNQFSVLDIAKLIKNYPKRNINLQLPQITIFLVWIGRVCKADMFKLIYQILLSHIMCYQHYLKCEKIDKEGRKNVKNWLAFVQKSKKKQIIKNQDAPEVKSNLKSQIIQKKEQHQQRQHQQQKQQQKGGLYQLRTFKIKMNVHKLQIQRIQRLLQFYQLWVKAVLPALELQKKFQEQILEKQKNPVSTVYVFQS